MLRASEMTKFLLIAPLSVVRLPILALASPSEPLGRLEIMLITPPTARLPHKLEPPPRTTSTRSIEDKGILNHWMVV